MARSTMQSGALLLGVLAISLCYAQEPVVIRLHDAVGDTVDLAERDSFRLFPNSLGFQNAVVLALPGPEFFAEITRDRANTTERIFLRIKPAELERIRFLIENREYAAQQRSDTTAALALASFWQSIEGRPFRNMSGEPTTGMEASPAPIEAEPAGKPATAREVTSTLGEPALPSQPQPEPITVVARLSDAVGDTIDATERNRFQLFPNTTGFRHAVFLTLPDGKVFAEVKCADGDTPKKIYYPILPGQLYRIRSLINSHPSFGAQAKSRRTSALAYFWRTIESGPLQNMAGAPAIVQEALPAQPEVATTGEPRPEPAAVVLRLRDAVGDTIDLVERDSFHLFPTTTGFQRAVILALPGPEFFAEITRDHADTTGRIFLRIMPAELERIRFLVDNPESTSAQQRSDSTYARNLASFWQAIEGRPLRNINGDPATLEEAPPEPPQEVPPSEPAAAQEVPPVPPETATTDEPQSEPAAVVLRLRDAVGDTIDAAERDSFGLFPNTAGFLRAVILAVSDFEHFASVERMDADSMFTVYYRILPDQLKRIRFLIDYRQFVAEQQKVDTGAVRSLAWFWQEIEQHPLPSMARRQEPAEIAATGGQLPTATIENHRYNYALHGAALGSIAGGIIGSWVGYGDAAACGFAAVGTYAGYKHGSNLDRRAPTSPSLRNEGTNWRICCALGAGAPGIVLGVATGALVASAGRSSWIPAALSGLCVTVEVVTLGYQLGRSIDRSRAY